MNSDASSPRLTLSIPAHASSLAFSNVGHLAVGSDDGSVRFYAPPNPKVVKALRGLGSTVSSIVFAAQDSSNSAGDAIWVACGRNAFFFPLDVPKLLYNRGDATICIELGQDDEDVLNEVALHTNRTHLAFSCDSGTVGVVDLANSNKIARMKIQHTSICGTVAFIPDRPNELVSGGYDSTLLHFDFQQGTLLSRYDFATSPPTAGVSLAPPFVLCAALAPTGLIAAGTADGRIMIGVGGAKEPLESDPSSASNKVRSKSKKKRTRKWGGLDSGHAAIINVAEGPVVAIAFAAPQRIVSSTLLGTLTMHTIVSPSSEEVSGDGNVRLQTAWTMNTQACTKVNALACHSAGTCIAVGGLAKDGKAGIVELWYPEGSNDGVAGSLTE